MISMEEQTEGEGGLFMNSLVGGQVAYGVFDLLPEVLFWVKNAAGVYMYGSVGFLRWRGVESNEALVGLSDHDFYGESVASVMRADDLLVMEEGAVAVANPELVPNVDGGVEWRETSRKAVYDRDGAVVGVAGVSRRLDFYDGRPGPTQFRDMSVILGVIYGRVDEDIRVADLAEVGGVSVSTLERMFKECMGTTPKQYFSRVKAHGNKYESQLF